MINEPIRNRKRGNNNDEKYSSGLQCRHVYIHPGKNMQDAAKTLGVDCAIEAKSLTAAKKIFTKPM